MSEVYGHTLLNICALLFNNEEERRQAIAALNERDGLLAEMRELRRYLRAFVVLCPCKCGDLEHCVACQARAALKGEQDAEA